MRTGSSVRCSSGCLDEYFYLLTGEFAWGVSGHLLELRVREPDHAVRIGDNYSVRHSLKRGVHVFVEQPHHHPQLPAIGLADQTVVRLPPVSHMSNYHFRQYQSSFTKKIAARRDCMTNVVLSA